jgi:DNA (cytosine-5)-methyltransferase 1
MAEIAAIPDNGLRVVSLFSGCGGSSLGYRMAGYKVIWANEFVEAARDTYRANFPETFVDPRDIRQISGADILAATGLAIGELDMLDGSPPCASFSTAGKRHQDWGKVKKYSDTEQRTDDLFFEYLRIVRELRPRRCIAENVSGLVKGVGKGVFLEILAGFRDAGYRVRARLLDAQWLGVPQARQRIFFVGVRDDLDIEPAFPTPLRYRYSVRDAIPWIGRQGDNGAFGEGEMRPATRPSPTIGAGPQTGNGRFPAALVEIEHANGFNGHAGQSIERPAQTVQADRPVKVMTKKGPRSIAQPAPTIVTHGRAHTRNEFTLAERPVRITQGSGNGHSTARGKVVSQNSPAPTIVARGGRYSGGTDQFMIEQDARCDGYSVGAELDKLGPGEQSEKYFQLVRAPLGGPSPTVTAYGGSNHEASVAHPIERRKFTIAELRRICGFPDDFVLTGTYAQQWERLGRSVPPPMMAALAAANCAPVERADADPATAGAENRSPAASELPSPVPAHA